MPAIQKSTSGLALLQRKQKMSLSQTYYLAHTARGKLSKEAGRADHDLRLLVGHANLLDGLMVDLADAEREQESWFNANARAAQSTTTTPTPPTESRRVTWADDLPTVAEDEVSSDDEDDVYEEEDDEDAEPRLQLVRTPSRSSPPELISHESESEGESEDEDLMMPPSPPFAATTHVATTTQKHKPEAMDMDDDALYTTYHAQAIAAY